MEDSERNRRGTEPARGEAAEHARGPHSAAEAGGGQEDRVVGTAVGSSEAGVGVAGGEVGRSSGPGDAAGGTHESRMSAPRAGEGEGEAHEASAGMDAAGFARATAKRGSEAGLAGGEDDLGGGGDLSGDFGGLDEEGDEGKPA